MSNNRNSKKHRCAKGEPDMTNQEFQNRVRNCERKLYGMAYMLLHTSADCEDAVQEALLRAWQKLRNLRDERYFETWLTRIVINECKNQLARKKRRGEAPLDPKLAAPASPEPELHAALMQVEWKYRILLTLKYIDGYSVEEISRILTLPKGTVSSRLNRAKALLKGYLRGDDEA